MHKVWTERAIFHVYCTVCSVHTKNIWSFKCICMLRPFNTMKNWGLVSRESLLYFLLFLITTVDLSLYNFYFALWGPWLHFSFGYYYSTWQLLLLSHWLSAYVLVIYMLSFLFCVWRCLFCFVTHLIMICTTVYIVQKRLDCKMISFL